MATACDPFAAARHIAKEVPDVITLDVEMPRMDGITFLRKLMAQRPIPVVMCSSLTEAGSVTLMQALEAGAVDVIVKPRLDTRQFLMDSKRAHLRGRQGGGARQFAPPAECPHARACQETDGRRYAAPAGRPQPRYGPHHRDRGVHGRLDGRHRIA